MLENIEGARSKRWIKTKINDGNSKRRGIS